MFSSCGSHRFVSYRTQACMDLPLTESNSRVACRQFDRHIGGKIFSTGLSSAWGQLSLGCRHLSFIECLLSITIPRRVAQFVVKTRKDMWVKRERAKFDSGQINAGTVKQFTTITVTINGSDAEVLAISG